MGLLFCKTKEMKLNDIKIGSRILLGFSIIMFISSLTILFSLKQINNLRKNTEKLHDHPLAVSNAIREVSINLFFINQYLEDIIHDKKTSEYSEILDRIEKKIIDSRVNFNIVSEKYLGDSLDIKMAYAVFNDLNITIDTIILKTQAKEMILANEIMEGKFQEQSIILTGYVNKIAEFARNKAQIFLDETLAYQQKSLRLLLIFLMMIMVAGVLIGIIIYKSINQPLEMLRSGIKKMSEGDLDYHLKYNNRDEFGLLAKAFMNLSANLKATQEDTGRKISYLNNIPTPVHVVDKDLTVQFINRAGAEFINKSMDDCIGMKCYNLFRTNHCRNRNCRTEMAMNSLSNEIGETFCNPSGDKKIPIRYISSALRDENNQVIGAIEYIIDTSDENAIINMAEKVIQGDYSSKILARSDEDRLSGVLNKMTDSIRTSKMQLELQNWYKTGETLLNEEMRGDQDLSELCRKIVTFVAKYVDAQVGTLYIKLPASDKYKLLGSYAYKYRKELNNEFAAGEGLIGQAAIEQQLISITEIPDNYIRISSGLGSTVPGNLLLAPFKNGNKTLGVLELGSINTFDKKTIDFIESILDNMAIGLLTAINRMEMQELLVKTKEQAEELQVQQEELRQTNEELESQTKALKKSEEFLQSQQEELRVINEELEEKTKGLEQQKADIALKNNELKKATFEIEEKARELEVTSKYKSEFLANMSHELRTPLNSLLLLAQNLKDNSKNNLTADQIESADIIHKSGTDLLNLINEILDLSKIEAGKMELKVTEVLLTDVVDHIKLLFDHQIKSKGLDFKTIITPDVPEKINSDEQRIEQVLKNLISNAIKFTHQGSVTLEFFNPNHHFKFQRNDLKDANPVAIRVKDTGIGIPEKKLHEIFEAFQQVDGGISRKYGGTGLGLSISKELAKLLGGEIQVKSEVDKGSEFTLILPQYIQGEQEQYTGEESINVKNDFLKSEKWKEKLSFSIPDDRDNIFPQDDIVLIIEDDPNFAKILISLCNQKGFKCIATVSGEEGIEFMNTYKPKAVLLDINLPGIDGWEVLERLKSNAGTRHIPVHIISADEKNIDALNKGAIGYLTKPVDKQSINKALDDLSGFIKKNVKDLLLVEDDEVLRKNIRNLLGSKDINIIEAFSGSGVMEVLKSNNVDCMVLDLGLPDMTGFELLKNLEKGNIKIPPVIIYTGKEITKEENNELQKYTNSIIIKGVKSEERLLDETSLFLHRVVDKMPQKQKKMLTSLYDRDMMFKDKKILLVDDDMRNVFALTQLFEKSHMKVLMADNGRKAIEMLEENQDTDLVLMDIMMPVMDGYEATRKIRKQSKYKNLPIIALTAKAMKDDREKCIQAGANDYLSKPVEVEKLLNLMRVWLYQ